MSEVVIQQEQKLIPMPVEQLEQIKKNMVENLDASYKAFTELLLSMPINPHVKSNALLFLNTSYVHMKEGISTTVLSLVEQQEAPVEPEQQIDAA
jgi:hypothetical protein